MFLYVLHFLYEIRWYILHSFDVDLSFRYLLSQKDISVKQQTMRFKFSCSIQNLTICNVNELWKYGSFLMTTWHMKLGKYLVNSITFHTYTPYGWIVYLLNLCNLFYSAYNIHVISPMACSLVYIFNLWKVEIKMRLYLYM